MLTFAAASVCRPELWNLPFLTPKKSLGKFELLGDKTMIQALALLTRRPRHFNEFSIDTSNEMISMAGAISGHNHAINLTMASYTELHRKLLSSASRATRNVKTTPSTHASYRMANAGELHTLNVDHFFLISSSLTHCIILENTKLPKLSFDLVTIMYGFHEVPMEGRARILNEARRILRRGGYLAIVDICPTYKPAAAMLAGEPFVLEYQQNIDSQLANLSKFRFAKRKSVVPGHVNLWLLTAA